MRRSDKQCIAKAFNLGNLDWLTLEHASSYNVAPSTHQPVIIADPAGEQSLRIMRWGLVPSWANNSEDFGNTFNANAEVISTKLIWRAPFHSRRCLVPADAYYEWLKVDTKTKQAYVYAMKDDALFAFAGIWERWTEPDVPLVLDSFSIITTHANQLAASVHTRVPVIIEPHQYDRWLIRDDLQPLPMELLRPYASRLMKAWKVERRVGGVGYDDPELCLEWE